MRTLPGESGRFQVNNSGIALVRKVHQQFPLDGGVIQGADLVEFISGIGVSQVKLLLNQLDRLLGKKLGGQVLTHFVPVPLLLQLVDS